jgi:D-aminopeptidase
MRVVISADMEAISQISDWREILACCPEYWATGRRRMTADVVAAAQGLLDAGADEVIVLDNHGSGNPENVIGARLPGGAHLESWDVFDLTAHGVDAMLQVGYHARAGVVGFVPHTYVPELRLRVDGEPMGEWHGRAWAADMPLLGITGHAALQRTLGSLVGTPFLVVQDSDGVSEGTPTLGDAACSAEAIRDFAATALRGLADAPHPRPPDELRFEAAFDEPLADGAENIMVGAAWQPTGDATFAVDLARWADARQPLRAAMQAATIRMAATLDGVDLSSPAAVASGDPTRVRRLADYCNSWLDALTAHPRADWPAQAAA